MLWFQTSKMSQGTMSDSTSQPSSWTAKSGKFALLSRAIKNSDIHLEVLSLRNRKSFELLLFSPNVRHFSQRFRRIQNWNRLFVYTALACSLAISTNLNFDLTFVTQNLIGSCDIRCEFWLVSRKDDCLECALRKSFWIKKLINKIFLHLSN